LKTRLSDADGDVRRVTITVLGALCGADVSPPPTRFLEGVMPLKSGQQVDNAVVEDVKECLRPALSDSDQAVQTEAAIVLGCLGEAQVTDRLIWLLMNTEFDYYQKGRIIRALGRIGTEEAMNAIPMFELEMLDLAPASDHQYINEWSSPICFEISAALSLGNSGPLLHVVTLWRSEGLSHTVEEAGSQEVSILAYRIDRLRYYSEKLAPAIVERGVKALDDLFECIAAANGGSYSESVEKEATYLLERIRKSANVEDLIRYLREAAGHDIVTKASLRSSGVEDVIYLVGKHCASWISTDRDPLLCAMLEDDRLVGLFITVHRESRWNEARLIAARALAHYVRLVGRETPMGMRACDEVVDPWLKEWEAEGEPGQYMRGLILSLCGDSRAVPLLLESLEDQEITTRFRAAALLLLEYHRDKRAITTMIDMLHDSDANRRIVAATTLGKIDDPRVTAALAGVVRDPERAVRSAAVSALQARGDESVVEPLIRALDEEDFWIREEVIDALGKIGGKRAAAALASVVLYHEDDRARGLALERLADIGDPSALEAFRRALKDEAPGVQSAATWGLRSWAANESDVENLRRIYAVMKESDSKWDRVSLVLKLRTIGTPDAARAIEHALQDPDELVRFLAILGLGELGSVAAVPALSRVVEEDTGVFQDTPLAKAAREAIEEIQKRNSGSGEHQ
jgi:HEAT repeat protein